MYCACILHANMDSETKDSSATSHKDPNEDADFSFMILGGLHHRETEAHVLKNRNVDIALAEACSLGMIDKCFELLNNGANPGHYIFDSDSWSTGIALHFALRQLSSVNQDTDKSSRAQLQQRWILLCEKLIVQGSKLEKQLFIGGDCLHRGNRQTALDMIVDTGNCKLLKLALETNKKNGIEMDKIINKESFYVGGMGYGSYDWYPIHTALKLCTNKKDKKYETDQLFSSENVLTMIKLLLEYGADVMKMHDKSSGMISDGDQCHNALHLACLNNNIEQTRLVLTQSKVEYDIDAISTFTQSKPSGLVLFDSDDEDFNIDNNSTEWRYPWDKIKIKQTVLHIAIANKNVNLARLLIIHGADACIDLIVTENSFESKKKKNGKSQHYDIFEYMSLEYENETDEVKDEMNNVLKTRFFPKMLAQYPPKRKKIIDIVRQAFPNPIAHIVLQYAL